MTRYALAAGLVLTCCLLLAAGPAAADEAIGVLVQIERAGDKDSFTVDGTGYGTDTVELLHQLGARNQVHGNAWDTRLVAVTFDTQTPLATLLTVGGMASKEGFNHIRFFLKAVDGHSAYTEITFGQSFVVAQSRSGRVRLLAGRDDKGELLTGLLQIESHGQRYMYRVDGRRCCEHEFLPELMTALRALREKQRAKSDNQGLTVTLATSVPLSKASAVDIIGREIGFATIRYFWHDRQSQTAQAVLRGSEFSLAPADSGEMRLVPK